MDPGAEGLVGAGQVATGLKQVSERMKGSTFVANTATGTVIDPLAIQLDSDRQRMLRNAVQATHSD